MQPAPQPTLETLAALHEQGKLSTTGYRNQLALRYCKTECRREKTYILRRFKRAGEVS